MTSSLSIRRDTAWCVPVTRSIASSGGILITEWSASVGYPTAYSRGGGAVAMTCNGMVSSGMAPLCGDDTAVCLGPVREVRRVAVAMRSTRLFVYYLEMVLDLDALYSGFPYWGYTGPPLKSHHKAFSGLPKLIIRFYY